MRFFLWRPLDRERLREPFEPLAEDAEADPLRDLDPLPLADPERLRERARGAAAGDLALAGRAGDFTLAGLAFDFERERDLDRDRDDESESACRPGAVGAGATGAETGAGFAAGEGFVKGSKPQSRMRHRCSVLLGRRWITSCSDMVILPPTPVATS